MSNDDTTIETPTEAKASPRRLRIAHVLVQPVLVWDDGTELTAGPPLGPSQMAMSAMPRFLDTLPAEVEALAAQLAEQEDADADVQA
ncbi:hypothetical protein SEA_SIXAMA_86 [Gordonia phage Sixama]|uniref:Uncharacterized protein n=1 Tax=Gordonia phage Sixama TaxID=2653271 RepID=A0A5Q2F736_9CAUD|nr:hypothetical protein PP302_gp086 [Gordonia phage Sixama]QGF20265.1 hypothetical protein SEA_SIXAMA_86 [Gordonia phage Sixama]